MKKRNLHNSRHVADGELADVNETELAKDGILGEKSTSETSTVSAKKVFTGPKEAEAYDNRDNNEKTESSDSESDDGETLNEIIGEKTDFMVDTNIQDIPLAVPVEDTNDKREVVPTFTKKNEGERSFEKKNKEKERTVRHGGYVAVMALSMLTAFGVLLFAIFYNPTARDEAVVSDSEESSDGDTEIGELDAVLPLNVSEIYQNGVRSAVTVKSVIDGKIVYGTGTVVFSDGYVATLFENVSGATSVSITLYNGTTLDAYVVGGDSTAGLALLRVGTYLEAVSIGDCDVQTGDRLYAIGTTGDGKLGSSLRTLDVEHSQRVIRVSDGDGTERKINAVQLSSVGDEAFGGCPVFDGDGRAVAMVISTDVSSASFAVSLSKAVDILTDIKNGEQPSDDVVSGIACVVPKLGIFGENNTQADVKGVRIVGFSDSDGDASVMLKEGDVIVKIGSNETESTSELVLAIEEMKKGDKAEIFVLRHRQVLSFFVTLN